MYFRLFCVLFISGATAAFVHGASEPTKVSEITLTRSGNSSGPDDVLTLRADGSASYAGNKNVERVGNYTGTIPTNSFTASFPLLAGMYESIHDRRGSTGKPTANVTVIDWRVTRDGKLEETNDLCPGLDPGLWAFEMAVRGVAADIDWKKADESKPVAAPHNVELHLAPSRDAPGEATVSALTANPWRWDGLRNILGAGATQTLQFKGVPGGKLELISTSHHSGSVNDHAKPDIADKVTSEACEIRGPVLLCEARPRTFAVVAGKLLIMNALVPAGEDQWYYVAADRDKDGNVVRIEEYLFKFTDNPLKVDAGKGTLQVRIGDHGPKADDVRFTLTRAVGGMRYLQVDLDVPSHVGRTQIALADSGVYGLVLDNLNLNSKVFSANPTAASN